MQTIERMISSSPNKSVTDKTGLAECIEACFACEQACVACADACLGESQIDMLKRCIRLNLDCADICATTGNILSRHTGYDANLTRAVLEACRAACKACGDECEQHAGMHDHCQVCAEVCRRCEKACQAAVQSM